MRHDVLMSVDKATVNAVEKLRTAFAKKGATMHDPHVTHYITKTAEEAEKIAERLNKHSLPYKVYCSGVTIN